MKRVIIGGGMAGMTCAVLSARNGMETVILERNSRLGKKLAMTGNGKCNIGNSNMSAMCYNDSQIVRRVLAEVSVNDYLNFLHSVGVLTYCDQTGRMYPLSDSASNVVDCFRTELSRLGVKVVTDANVTAVKRSGGQFVVEHSLGREIADDVVVACGSGSQASPPSCGWLNKEWLTPLAPSLVPVKIANMDKQLNGIRARAAVTLVCDGTPISTEHGEVQFKEYGLSGICIFNLSATIARNIVKGESHTYAFEVDLFDGTEPFDLATELAARKGKGYQPPQLFYGLLHNKLAECVLKRASSSEPAELAKTAKHLCFTFEKLLDFSMSQVTAGGVADSFLDKNFRLPSGVRAIGEVLNVDGVCGGYNLFFAAASAMCLAKGDK